MAGRWAAGAGARTRTRTRGPGPGPGEAAALRVTECNRPEPGPQRDSLEEYSSPSSLADLTITGLDATDLDAGGILGAFHGCIDQSIISIIEDSSPAENKTQLDEESEATLLTALTEILDTVDDENPSPFDTLPDSELFTLPKDGHGRSLVGSHSWAVFPDSGKEFFGHLIPAVPRGSSSLRSSEKQMKRSFGEGLSQQCSDGEEEDMISIGQDVSEPGSELLDLRLDGPLDAAGEESSVTFVIGQNLPCVINVEHVSLSNLVKYIHPYCLPSGTMCLGTGTDSPGDMVELDIHVVQENELLDLQVPAVLCGGGQCPSGVKSQVDAGQNAGEEPGLGGDPAPDNSLQTPQQREVLPLPTVHQKGPPVSVRKRGRPRKTPKPTETADIAAQQNVAKTPRTRLQAAEDERKTLSNPRPSLAHQEQEGRNVTLQESRCLALQTVEVELGTRTIQTRGRAAARGESRPSPTGSKIAQGPRKQASSETRPGLRGWRSSHNSADAQVERGAAEPQPGPGETVQKQLLVEESSPGPAETPRAGPAETPRAGPAETPRAGPAETPSVPVCVVPSPAVSAVVCSEKPQVISLQQYRLRLQQRQRDSQLSAYGEPRPPRDSSRSNTWPVVPIQSIVQGELSVLPLETISHTISRQTTAGCDGRVSAPPSLAPVLPGHTTRGQLAQVQPRTKQETMISQTLQKIAQGLKPVLQAAPDQTPARQAAAVQTPARQAAPVQTPARQAAPVQTPARQAAPVQTPARQAAPVQTPARQAAPDQTPARLTAVQLPPVVPQAAAVRMCDTPLVENSPFSQSHLIQAKPVQVPRVRTVPIKSAPALVPRAAPAQRHQSTQEGLGQNARSSSAQENAGKDNPKGIEATDLMSLLEQFEGTEATDEHLSKRPPQDLSPGSSAGCVSLEDGKLLDQLFGPELASTAGLTPPATPPHQFWKALPLTSSLGTRKVSGATDGPPGSPLRTVRLIEENPLPQNNRTKCVQSVSQQPGSPLSAPGGFGDHQYCLPRVLATQPPARNICQQGTAQPDVGCRWNIKRQASITIKPIISLNHRCPNPSNRVAAAEQRVLDMKSIPHGDRNVTCSQETARESQESSDSLSAETKSVQPGRSCSETAASGSVGCDSPLRPEGEHCVTLSMCRNVETGTDKRLDSPQHCSRTQTSPCYRHQGYSSSSSSDSWSRSRSRSPARKRRRYCRRRSHHSRHSSQSDSRSSSRSRSYSRSNSRSVSGSRSRSRSRSSHRRSVRMSYYTDDYDPYDEEPRNRYSRHEPHEQNSSGRRELAIEERRVVYVGKIRNGMMREELRRRFEVFGEIEDCNIYFRNEGDNYGFVTYRYTCDAFAAIENGQTLRKPDELPFDLCFGGRRQFCKTNYADLDSSHGDFSSYSTKSKFDSLDFDTLLKQAKRSLQR